MTSRLLTVLICGSAVSGCSSLNNIDAALEGYEFISSVTLDQQVVDVYRHKNQTGSWMGKREFQPFGQIDSTIYRDNLRAIEIVSECKLVPTTVMNAGPTTTILVECL